MKGFEDSPSLSTPSFEDGKNFWENEFMQCTIHCPDKKITENKVSIGVAAGFKTAEQTRSMRELHYPN
jgi:hypothetical protein